ncbi:hypothetical protein N0V82_006243 [Gnomoniopsis sp. IMI 355080]|nr:hypothetical protein N0V82_006243 [Gnomoniopsis sp. IMI 355080]
MVLSYIEDDQEDDSSSDASEKTITQHHRAEDAASVIAPSIAYSTLTGASSAQLGAGLFNAASSEDDIDKDLREALEDLDEGQGHDALTPNGFMKPLLDRDGSTADFLTNGKYSTCHDDIEGETRRDFERRKRSVYGALQKAVGLPQKKKTDDRIVIGLLRIYARAREQEILCFAINGKEPPLPSTALNALLLMLMDRYIVFYHTHRSIRRGRDSLPFDKRLDERSSTVQRAIEAVEEHIRDEESRLIKSANTDDTENSMGQEAQPAMWTHFGAMIPSDELELSYPKPWFAEEWLRKNVPKEAWPQTAKRVMVRQGSTTTQSQQAAKTDKPEPLSGQMQHAQSSKGKGQDLSSKRKREESEDIVPEDRSKAVKAGVKMENTYFTMGNLVYRPKV